MGPSSFGNPSIIITLEPAQVKATPGGGPVQVRARVHNAGTAEDQYALEIGGLDPTWYTLDTRLLPLFPGDSVTVPIKLHPPKGSKAQAGRYNFEVRALSQNDPGSFGVAAGSLEVVGEPLSISMVPSEVTLYRGDPPVEIAGQVSISATVPDRDQYNFEITGLDPAWYTLEVAGVAIFPGDGAGVPVKLHVPRKGPSQPAKHDFMLRGYSLNNPTVAGGAQGTLEVMPDPLQIGLTPPAVSIAKGDPPAEVRVTLLAIPQVRGMSGSGEQLPAPATSSHQYGLEAQGLDPAWYTLQPSVSLLPNVSVDIPLKLHPPPTVTAPGALSFLVRIRSLANPGLSVEAEGSLQLTGDPVLITLTPPNVTITPGEQPQSIAVKLANISALVDRYDLQVSGPDPTWFSLGLQSVALMPGDGMDVPLKVEVTRRSQIKAGTYPFTVGASNRHHVKPVGVQTGSIILLPYAEFQADLDPQRATGSQGQYKLTLINGGNYDLRVELLGRDPDDALLYNFGTPQPQIQTQNSKLKTQNSVEVPAWGKLEIPLSVSLKVGNRQAQSRMYQFTLTARAVQGDGTPDAAGEKLLQGIFDYAAPPPPNWLRATLQPPRLAGLQGNYNVALQNDGTEDLIVELSTQDPNMGLVYNLGSQRVVVPARNQVMVTLAVSLSTRNAQLATGQQSRTYPFVVSVRGVKADGTTDPRGIPRNLQGIFDYIVPITEVLRAALQPPRLVGQQGSYNVALQNDKNRDLIVELSAQDPDGALAFSFGSQRVVIPPRNQVVMPVVVSLRAAGPQAQVRPYPFTVTARAVLADGTPDPLRAPRSLPGVLEYQRPGNLLRASLQPPHAAGLQGNYNVALQNDGTSDLVVELSAQDPDTALSYSFAYPKVVVPARSRVMAPLVTSVEKEGYQNRSGRYEFVVAARAVKTDGSTDPMGGIRSLMGALNYAAPRTNWGKRALIAAVILLALGGGFLAFMALRPKSTTVLGGDATPTPTPIVKPASLGGGYIPITVPGSIYAVSPFAFILPTRASIIPIPISLPFPATGQMHLIECKISPGGAVESSPTAQAWGMLPIRLPKPRRGDIIET